MQKRLPLTVVTMLFMLVATLPALSQQTTPRSTSSASKSNVNNEAAETIYNAKNVEVIQQKPASQPASGKTKAPSSVSSNLPAKSNPSIYDDPNKGRRLPKNYDDSKTNIQSK